MKGLSAEDLEIAMDTKRSFDVRKDALTRLLADAWKRGWDECSEEWAKSLRESKVVPPMLGWDPANQ